jgi:hypothetical protein
MGLYGPARKRNSCAWSLTARSATRRCRAGNIDIFCASPKRKSTDNDKQNVRRSSAAPGSSPWSQTSVRPKPKAALLSRLRAMKAEWLSLQMIADQLNAEDVPTLSERGKWQRGTIGNLLSEAQAG